jgi:hypothetical protein
MSRRNRLNHLQNSKHLKHPKNNKRPKLRQSRKLLKHLRTSRILGNLDRTQIIAVAAKNIKKARAIKRMNPLTLNMNV